MSHQPSKSNELDKCSFCNEIKPVLRRYVHAGNKELDDNKQKTFVIIKYCDDCGIEAKDTEREKAVEEERKLVYEDIEGWVARRRRLSIPVTVKRMLEHMQTMYIHRTPPEDTKNT